MRSVSVVVPAFETDPAHLREAVLSAADQRPAPLEVLVIDDGSGRPLDIPDHPLVRVVRQPNQGVPAARNRGLAEARGDIVALLDHDDVWLPGKLEAQLEMMTPGVGLCSTGFDLLVDGERRPGWGGGAEGYAELLRGNGVAASTVMVTRWALDDVGGFDERLAMADDWDLWLRVARACSVRHVARPLVLYRMHEGMASRNYRAMWSRSVRVLWRHRRALPVRGLARCGAIYGAQAFDAFRRDRRATDLVWSLMLSPRFVGGELARYVRPGR